MSLNKPVQANILPSLRHSSLVQSMGKTPITYTNKEELIALGPLLPVHIGLDIESLPIVNLDSMLGPLPALVDTGAYDSCVAKEIALELQLPIVGQRDVFGVSGQFKANVHLAQIHIPDLDFTLYGRFAGVDLVGGVPYSALLGRTFLQYFTMVYEGSKGIVTFDKP